MAIGERLTDVKVGAFVLAALAILVAGSLWIAGTSLGGRKVSYTVLLPESGGVTAGDRVRVAGVSVGRIRRVDLRLGEEWPVSLQVDVRAELPIEEDSTASIATSGLIGNNYLQIVSGTTGSPRLPPGGTIYGGSRAGIQDALSQVDAISGRVIEVLERSSALIEQLSAEITPIARNLERLLSQENVEDVREIVSGLRGTMDEAGPRITTLLDRMDSLAGRVEEGTEGIPELASRMSSLVEDLERALGTDGERLASLLDTAGGSLVRADRVLGVLDDHRDELGGAISDLSGAASSLKSLARQLEERPYSLIRIRPARERRPGDDQ